VESGRRFGDPISYDQLIQLDAHGWELYNLKEDFAETNNLAASERDRLIAMIGMWYVEAGKYNVLPIDSRGTQRFAVERPQITADRQRYIYYPGTQMVPLNAAPRVLNRPHSISVEVEVPADGAEGVLFSMGGNDGGFAFYVQNGLLTYGYNYVAEQFFRVHSSGPLPAGHHIVSAEFTPTGAPDLANGKGTPAKVVLFVDGEPVGEGDLPVTIPLSLGLAAGVAVSSIWEPQASSCRKSPGRVPSSTSPCSPVRATRSGARGTALVHRMATSISPTTTGEIEKGKSITLSKRALPRKRRRAMAVAAARPKIVLKGTAMAVANRVRRRAASKSLLPRFCRNTPGPLAKA